MKKLVGNLKGAYSRRINIQHRLVYEVVEDAKTVKILSLLDTLRLLTYYAEKKESQVTFAVDFSFESAYNGPDKNSTLFAGY